MTVPTTLMRKQYYFRASPEGLLAWDVDQLVVRARDLPVRAVPLLDLHELDSPVFGDEAPTWRSLVAHLALLEAADLAYPIILSADGSVMDGRHRLAKALHEGRSTIDAVQFVDDPPPDFIGKEPNELPY